MLVRLSAPYAAGALAALASSLAVWIVGRADLTTAIGVAIAPTLTWEWLAPRLVWGGLWALGFPFIRPRKLSPIRKGLLLSLAPSAAQLFYFLPEAGLGAMGRGLGQLTPVVVVLTNALWGYVLARVMMTVQTRSSKAE